MLQVDIPGRGTLNLAHLVLDLVLDLNGTIALDGEVLPGVAGRLATLAESLTIHLVTADTHGKAAATASHLGVQLARIEPGDEANQKRANAWGQNGWWQWATEPTTWRCCEQRPWGSPSWARRGWQWRPCERPMW